MNFQSKWKLKLFFIFILLVIAIMLSIHVFGPDKVLEEAAEKYIEKKTGIRIDLTPSSPENLAHSFGTKIL